MARVRGLTGWFLGTGCETKNGHVAFARVRVRVGKLHFASNFHANDKNICDTADPDCESLYPLLRTGNISITIPSIKSHRCKSRLDTYLKWPANFIFLRFVEKWPAYPPFCPRIQ